MEDSFRMKGNGVYFNGGRWGFTSWGALIAVLGFGILLILQSSQAEDEKGKEKGSSNSLGGLLDSLKDLKVPDSVTKLPEQLKEMKDAYLKTTETVEALQKEVAILREEVKEMRAQQSRMKEVASTEVVSGEVMEIREVTAEQLIAAFAEDSASAKQNFRGEYLQVRGAIQGFETRSKEIVIFLRGETSDARVKCSFTRDNSFHVEVMASQGRMVSRNDRTTLLTVGQPVTILGTCTGRDIDVTMVNCRVEDIDSQRKPESKSKK